MAKENNTNEHIVDVWQHKLWRITMISAIILVCLELLIFIMRRGSNPEGYGTTYFVINVALVALLYAATLAFAQLALKSENMDRQQKNWAMAWSYMIIMFVPVIQCYKILPMTTLAIVPMVVLIVLDNRLISMTSMFVTLGVTIINCIRLYNVYSWDEYGYGMWFASTVIMVIVFYIAVQIVNSHTHEMIESLSVFNVQRSKMDKELKKDPMTGLYNRRSFEETLEDEIDQAKDGEYKTYIAVFDIDHFKNVNDTYGHSNGDIVIKALCKMLKAKSEKYGMAFRYGGEEFVVLLRDIELSKVLNIVEDIRTEFRCYYFQFMNSDGITCSCGIAQHVTGEDAKAWFNRADSSLYQAKEGGRNRTVISE